MPLVSSTIFKYMHLDQVYLNSSITFCITIAHNRCTPSFIQIYHFPMFIQTLTLQEKTSKSETKHIYSETKLKNIAKFTTASQSSQLQIVLTSVELSQIVMFHRFAASFSSQSIISSCYFTWLAFHFLVQSYHLYLKSSLSRYFIRTCATS